MKMIWMIAVLAGLAAVVPVNPVYAADVRHGVVIAMEPIDNRGEDETEQVKKRRKIGSALGTLGKLGIGASGKADGAAAVLVGSGAVEAGAEAAAAKIGGPGPATRYMVKVRLDSRKVLAVTQLRAELGDVSVGSRVVVRGTGDGAKISAE